MKRSHIAIIIVIAVAIGAIMTTLKDASTYVGFEEAWANPGTKYTVIGYLDKEAPYGYDAQQNTLRFMAVDKEGERQKVVYRETMPQGFDRSEEITMKGFATDTAFVAEQILMKCPSKYNEQNHMSEEGYQATSEL